jgi:hypothetical protein
MLSSSLYTSQFRLAAERKARIARQNGVMKQVLLDRPELIYKPPVKNVVPYPAGGASTSDALNQINYIGTDALPGDDDSRFKQWSKDWDRAGFRTQHWIWYWSFRVSHVVTNFRWKLGVELSSKLVEGVIYRPKDLRHLLLNDQKLHTFIGNKSHSHATAAAFRTSMNTYMNDVACTAGFTPFNVSKSPKDIGRGTRYFYGPKDCGTSFSNDQVTDNSCIIMCDTDYYTNINDWMQYFKPIIMYTMIPTQVAGRDVDYAYRFDKNELEFQVAGGSTYRHQLWNYTGDVATVIDKYNRLLIFNLEQRNIPSDPFHRFVVLTPMAAIPAPYYNFMEQRFPIERLRILKDGVNTLYEPIKDKLSLSKDGSWHSVEILGKVFSAIQERLNNKESEAVVSDVERLLKQADIKTYAIDAPLLFELMKATISANVVVTNGSVASYQCLGNLATEDGKPTGRAVSTPLVSKPALFPCKGVNADEATIKGRVNDVRNNTVPPSEFRKFAREFVLLVVPEEKRGKGVPLHVADVRKVQNAPNQVARYKKVATTLSIDSENQLKAFLKAEAGKVGPPRNITTCKPENTMNASRFTLAAKPDLMKWVKWFGPGLTPKQTTERLRELAAQHENFLCIDYTKLDGTVSEFLQRQIVFAIYTSWCALNDRAELLRHLKQIFKQKAFSAEGLSYDPGWGTRSGSAPTTDGNTWICAYVLFCALRKLGYTPEEAYAELGLLYGDDGATPALPGLKEMMEQVARELGLIVKLEVIEKGQPIPYLGRLFIDPVTTADSFQDPIRTLSKIHLTANNSVSREQALSNKALGYLATDAKTPLIGTWARRIIELTGLTRGKGLLHEEQYKLSNAWSQRDEALIRDALAAHLNLSVPELLRLDELIKQAPSLDQFPVILHTEREIKISAAVDGEVVEPGPHIEDCEDENLRNEPNNQPTATDRPLPRVASNGGSSRKNHRLSDDRQAEPVPNKVHPGRTRTRTNRPQPSPGPSRRRDKDSLPGVRQPRVGWGTDFFGNEDVRGKQPKSKPKGPKQPGHPRMVPDQGKDPKSQGKKPGFRIESRVFTRTDQPPVPPETSQLPEEVVLLE